LGPDGRGHLAATLQPLTVADAFAAFGLPMAVTYFVARGVDRRVIVRASLIVGFVSSAIVLVALALYVPAVSDRTGLSSLTLHILWTTPAIGVAIAVRRSFWQGSGEVSILDAERALGSLLRLAVVVALFGLGFTSSGPFAVAYLAAGILASSVLMKRLPRRRMRNPAEPSAAAVTTNSIVRFSAAAGIGTIAIAINNRIDQAVLPAMVSSHDLGLYAVAVTVAELPVVITVVTSRNLFTESSNGSSRSTLLQTAGLGLVAVASISLILIAVAGPLISIVFGSEFEGAIAVLRILSASTAISFVAVAAVTVAAGKGRPAWSSLPPLAGAAGTVGLLFAFRSSMSPVTAAWISVFSASVSALIGLLLLAQLSRNSRSNR
jgi:O-antigen/teichoic acid export membrane protein